MNHSHRGNRLVINFNKRKSSIIFPEFVYFLGKKKLRWVHCRFFIRCFQRGIVLIVILRFVVGWLRGRQARSYMAIKRLLEKAVRQSLFSLIKWITAAKATGWSSTFAKKSSITFSEFGILCSNNPFPKYLWFSKRPEMCLRLSLFGTFFWSVFKYTLKKSLTGPLWYLLTWKCQRSHCPE